MTFDCFIILHVLEHIQDERRALKELFRVLKPGGWGIVQVPMDLTLQKTKEDPSADTPEKRLAAFGQDDHVRLYGKDFKQRLENEGFKVECVDMWSRLAEIDRERYRISENEPFYHVKKGQ
jgi:ubiquinone/menaquinone biosynthesis C-methylase UbiE